MHGAITHKPRKRKFRVNVRKTVTSWLAIDVKAEDFNKAFALVDNRIKRGSIDRSHNASLAKPIVEHETVDAEEID